MTQELNLNACELKTHIKYVFSFVIKSVPILILQNQKTKKPKTIKILINICFTNLLKQPPVLCIFVSPYCPFSHKGAPSLMNSFPVFTLAMKACRNVALSPQRTSWPGCHVAFPDVGR